MDEIVLYVESCFWLKMNGTHCFPPTECIFQQLGPGSVRSLTLGHATPRLRPHDHPDSFFRWLHFLSSHFNRAQNEKLPLKQQWLATSTALCPKPTLHYPELGIISIPVSVRHYTEVHVDLEVAKYQKCLNLPARQSAFHGALKIAAHSVGHTDVCTQFHDNSSIFIRKTIIYIMKYLHL